MMYPFKRAITVLEQNRRINAIYFGKEFVKERHE